MSVSIDTDACEASGTCAMVCPEDVLEFRDGMPVVVKNAACTNCWICVENCCSGAITVD